MVYEGGEGFLIQAGGSGSRLLQCLTRVEILGRRSRGCDVADEAHSATSTLKASESAICVNEQDARLRT